MIALALGAFMVGAGLISANGGDPDRSGRERSLVVAVVLTLTGVGLIITSGPQGYSRDQCLLIAGTQ